MKTLTIVLILLAFIQTTIIPVDLVLMVILLRAYIKVEKTNLYLAFILGLLVAYLQQLPLGVFSLLYLVLTQLTHLFSKLPVSKNFFSVVPLICILLSSNELVSLLFAGRSPDWFRILWGSLLALPLYFVLKIWEERFVVRPEIKLKV